MWLHAGSELCIIVVEHGWTATPETLAPTPTFRWSEKAKRGGILNVTLTEIYLILIWFLWCLCSSVCLQSFFWGIRNNPVSTKSRTKVWKKSQKQIKGVPKRELLLILVLWSWVRQLQLFLFSLVSIYRGTVPQRFWYSLKNGTVSSEAAINQYDAF